MQRNKMRDLMESFDGDDQLLAMQEILGANSEEAQNQILNFIDRMYPGEAEIKSWLLSLLRPFLLALFNEQRFDYSELILEEARRTYNNGSPMKRQNTQDLMRDNSLQELNRESLGKRFEARIKMLL
jgi:hypothetical protein